MSCYRRVVGAELPRLVVNYILQAEKIETREIILTYLTASGKKIKNITLKKEKKLISVIMCPSK